MAVATGSKRYKLGAAPCEGTDIAWTEEELANAIDDPVFSVVFM
uniref:Uncharacterized protein n=1 Tax=Candidatus Kentrum sp. TC TaxID=2126339 RepID=A0A451A5A6_9GAMM|nr:MAG: hypothetical protein BECKTC1821E_GA0114239_105610 [Candidatus Kentron sp. TC]VFK61183.1 MAG: hypothetical protein BECKTC1821F_GA0114240_10559 [Candidatus Kentron sp. TC]